MGDLASLGLFPPLPGKDEVPRRPGPLRDLGISEEGEGEWLLVTPFLGQGEGAQRSAMSKGMQDKLEPSGPQSPVPWTL